MALVTILLAKPADALKPAEVTKQPESPKMAPEAPPSAKQKLAATKKAGRNIIIIVYVSRGEPNFLIKQRQKFQSHSCARSVKMQCFHIASCLVDTNAPVSRALRNGSKLSTLAVSACPLLLEFS